MTYKSRIVLTFFISIILSVAVFLLVTFLLLKSTLWGEQINEQYMREVRDIVAEELERTTLEESISIINRYAEDYLHMEFELLTDQFDLIHTTGDVKGVYSREWILDRLSQHASWAQEEWVVAKDITYPSEDEAILLIVVNKNDYQSIMVAFNNKGVGLAGKIFLIGLIITLVISGGIAFLFMQKTTFRLYRLNNALSQFEMGNLNIRIEDAYNDEIGHLADVFNQMTHKIKKQINNREKDLQKKHLMVTSLSHDLRTPLTLIAGYIEALENKIYHTQMEQEEAFNILKKNTKAMEKMLDDLLELMKLEVNEKVLVFELCDINELIRRLVIEYIPLLKKENIELDINIPSCKHIVEIDIPSMQRVVRNLIVNAMKYGKTGKYIGISCLSYEGKVVITIKDKGEGIEERHKTKIFESFYRVDQSRNTEFGSMGIGLFIAKEFTELNRGKIYMESEIGKETVFCIEFELKSFNK
ncbi:sensor histidine kinase [Vallitalea okinawensis]|uniref:sensor histidine kinase n=1 Tax=Vallitalea okinawensis TaxID=2078660 RepID=UPI000CFDD357|nr:HAMP domain-containing sensor histidine kinase [Vallitalea okinawensis]